MRIAGALLLAGLLVGAAGTAGAQVQRPVTFGVSAGYSAPVGDLGDFVDGGWHVQGHLGFLDQAPVGLRLDVGYQSFKGDEDNLRQIIGTLNGTFGARRATAGSVAPYFIAGAGLYNSRLEFDDDDDDHDHDHDHGNGSTTRFGVNGGAGIRFGLAGMSTFLEARLHNVFDSGESLRIVPISFGINF